MASTKKSTMVRTAITIHIPAETIIVIDNIKVGDQRVDKIRPAYK